MPPRSYLFVPATQPARVAKALLSGAHSVIVDLEDAVAPEAKDEARRALADHLALPGPPVVVRLNAAGTGPFHDDLALCAAHPRVEAVMLPKAGQRLPRGELDVEQIGAAHPRLALIALIESAEGLDRLREVASAPTVRRLAFGSLDFQADLGLAGSEDDLMPYRAELVLRSRVAGLPAPIDGVSTSLDDAPRIEAEAVRARQLGFGAKLCIHPRQLPPIHRAFAPSAIELEWARRVVEAARAADGAAVAVDGRMVDRPVVRRAEALLQAGHGAA